MIIQIAAPMNSRTIAEKNITGRQPKRATRK
jgi:hypothetical protein